MSYGQTSIDTLQTNLDTTTYTVTAEINGEPLRDVSWKELPGKVTTGIFNSTSEILTPQKRGFWFSPDIFNFNDFNNNKPKIFRAFKYDIKEKLKVYMPLNGTVNNLISLEDVKAYSDIAFSKDEQFGKVAIFNGVSSYIDLRNEKDIVFNELTIAAWVKPATTVGRLSIVGKGKVFSAKISNGHLQFTTPGIKDHFSDRVAVKAGVWTHVAFVYLPSNELCFYVNGELVYKIIASRIEQTNHSILVGTNLWGENYEGLMANLGMWQRALSDNEIKQIYSVGVSVENEELHILPLIVLGIVVCFLIVFLSVKNRKRASPRRVIKYNKIELELSTGVLATHYTIQCLGGFKVLNSKREDITHKFSPKRRELLLCLILYTLREGGITSKKMGQILWPGFSSARVKNNRSTQIKEIRKVFVEEPDLEIVYSDKKWKLEIGKSSAIDLFELQKNLPNLFNSKQDVNVLGDIHNILPIVNSGVLLPNFDVDWIDPFKARYDSFILEILTPYLSKNNLDDTYLIEIIDAILIIDPLHEDAVKSKIEILIRQGKHMSAQKVTEHFKRLYEQFYEEPYLKELI
ncbi:LamG domain-containing protein [Snuella sedimenti]|uniref:LamG-like jellyroll fold domain-containing protein n=1 Tax=Snuella sedimenti TaxID=2798802 RepID=A0A8J7J732_9FLAO|nr:LamG-like jellyroll fold domain-containing protein [Snuella sedimenti]MBJ6369779.1 hypothetical protein [Snuella sedimenti]